jgi:hypothetical protein
MGTITKNYIIIILFEKIIMKKEWGYLKDNVYENNPQTIGELKAAITAKIREIP